MMRTCAERDAEQIKNKDAEQIKDEVVNKNDLCGDQHRAEDDDN